MRPSELVQDWPLPSKPQLDLGGTQEHPDSPYHLSFVTQPDRRYSPDVQWIAAERLTDIAAALPEAFSEGERMCANCPPGVSTTVGVAGLSVYVSENGPVLSLGWSRFGSLM